MASGDLVFEQLKLGPMDNFQYVFGSRSAGTTAIVDPGFEPRRMLSAAQQGDLEVSHVVLTHGHRDHIAALGQVQDKVDAELVAHPDSQLDPDVPAEDGVGLEVAGVEVVPHHAPGHAPDHAVYELAGEKLLTGDALFVGDCGRVDLPGADVEDMWDTLMNVLPSLDPDLEVYPGHDYGPEPHRSLATELEENFTLEKRGLDEFEDFMGV
jgi:glyoxylase-like metal-dependent hydrolase (beta-lactamase superfamily II)